MSAQSGPIIFNKPPLTEGQIACVELLKEALAQALEGSVTTVGIVVCMKTGFASVMAGTQAADLNLACDDLKRKILDVVTGGNVARAAKSSIITRGRN